MELHIIAIILIVFLVSLGSLLFISKLPKGKTFDEMLAEKKQMQQLLAASAVLTNAGNRKSGDKKSGGGKKGQQQQKKQQQQKSMKGKQVVRDESNQSSDSEESSSSDGFNDMEFLETEQFNILSAQQQKRKNQQQQSKKGAGKAKSGILVNKSDSSPMANAEVDAPEINHFEQTQPKDVIAMKTEKPEDAGEKEAKLQAAKNGKDNKKGKQQSAKKEQVAPPAKPANAVPAPTKEAAPISPKNTVAAKPQEKPMPQRTVAVVEEKPKVSAEPVKFETNPEPVKEKVNKKKKVDGKMAKHVSSGHEDEHVNTLIHSIGHTELTHNEIQMLIEFLLNKQQDTISKDPTEWTEGKSDVMQKLKKQLQECGKQLLDEKQASVAFQNKLRELRAEMNNDKVVHAAHTKTYMEQMKQKMLDIQTLSNEVKYLNDKFTTEKQQLTQQCQQLQAKLMQLNGQEHDFGQQIQQLKEANTLLQQDLANKNKMVAEMQIFAKQNTDTMHKMGELEQKFQDYEMMLHKKDEHIGYLQQDIHTRSDEIHRLNGELQRQKEEFDKVVGDLQAQEQAAVAANHDEENSKVEIRNLQNALDSAKNGSDGFKQQVDELQTQIETLKGELAQAILKRNEVNEQKLAEFSKMDAQIKELKSREDQIVQQLEEQKTKNDHLKQTQQPKIDVDQIILDEQNRTKELLTKILPDLSAVTGNDDDDYAKWIELAAVYIKTQLTCSSSVVDKQTTTNDNGNSLDGATTTTNYKIHHSHNNGSAGDEEETAKTSQGDVSTLLLKNVELQKVVDEYKNNLAKAYQLLDSLQAKADEQDNHWRKVVQSKENEMVLLKAATNNVTTAPQEQQS